MNAGQKFVLFSRSRLHFIKFIKKNNKTVKLWECGICCKEFRQQYRLMRHLPIHTGLVDFTSVPGVLITKFYVNCKFTYWFVKKS